MLGVDRTRLFLDSDLTVEGPAVRAYQDLVRRRSVGREPVAYLLGRQGFRHLELHVDPRVLIPRPETEHAVEAVVELAPPGARVVDVGTGSGAIALALKDERPDLDVTGSDISEDALAVARANAGRLGLDVAFVHADGPTNPQGARRRLRFDVVVANPPYIAEGDPRVEPDVHAHEPHVALYAGDDGLELIRRLVAGVPAPLLVLEVGEGQDQEVARLAKEAGYARVTSRGDLAGHRADRDRVGLADDFEACVAGGGIVVFPADTVYGLACDPAQRGGVARLYALKGRAPEKRSATMHFTAETLPDLPPRTAQAIRSLTPGPLTFVVAQLGLRLPEVPLLQGVRTPVLQSSANHAGGPDARRLARRPAGHPRCRGPRHRRRRAAGHRLDGRRSHGLRGHGGDGRSCARARSPRQSSRRSSRLAPRCPSRSSPAAPGSSAGH